MILNINVSAVPLENLLLAEFSQKAIGFRGQEKQNKVTVLKGRSESFE